jgi:hypothetical protein
MRKIALILFIFGLVLVFTQIGLLWRDRKKNPQKPVKFSLLKLIPFLLSIVGFLSFALPWIHLPMIGGLSFFALVGPSGNVSASTELVLLWLVFVACFGLMSSATFFQLVFKVPVKSKITLLLEILVGLTATLLGILLIGQLKSAFSGVGQTFLGDIFQISIGFGAYLATSIGILYAVFVVWMNYHSTKTGQASDAPHPSYDHLRELKKLRDEGVITDADFEQQKATVLNSQEAKK